MISILNIGNGNVRAFHHILDDLNIANEIIDSPEQVEEATHLILPGVGSFDDVMRRLNDGGFSEKLDLLKKSKQAKILGVCVGMQVMFTSSEEGDLLGLNWIPGKVKKIHSKDGCGKVFRIPHMGWNSVDSDVDCPLFEGIKKEKFYFLHSYTCSPDDKHAIIAKTQFGDHLVAAVQTDNVFGVQFHPEKGHRQGRALLKNFYGDGNG